MTEDLRRHHATDEDCINHALSEVQKILTRADQRLETFKLPMPRAFDEARFTNKALYRELNFDHRRGLETAEAMREQMYPQQKRGFRSYHNCCPRRVAFLCICGNYQCSYVCVFFDVSLMCYAAAYLLQKKSKAHCGFRR